MLFVNSLSKFVNSHRVDIQTLLIASYCPTDVRPTEITVSVLIDVNESELGIDKLLNPFINPESVNMHNLNKTLSFAFKYSTSEL